MRNRHCPGADGVGLNIIISSPYDRSRIRAIRRGCTNIIGFAPRKSTVARRRPDERGKAAAQSRTQPDAGLGVQRSISLKPSVGQ
jgi:hypothetical protein